MSRLHLQPVRSWDTSISLHVQYMLYCVCDKYNLYCIKNLYTAQLYCRYSHLLRVCASGTVRCVRSTSWPQRSWISGLCQRFSSSTSRGSPTPSSPERSLTALWSSPSGTRARTHTLMEESHTESWHVHVTETSTFPASSWGRLSPVRSLRAAMTSSPCPITTEDSEMDIVSLSFMLWSAICLSHDYMTLTITCFCRHHLCEEQGQRSVVLLWRQ